MNILIYNRANESEDKIADARQILENKFPKALLRSMQEDSLDFRSNHFLTWIRDIVSGYQIDGTERYHQFVLINRFLKGIDRLILQLMIETGKPCYYLDENKNLYPINGWSKPVDDFSILSWSHQ